MGAHYFIKENKYFKELAESIDTEIIAAAPSNPIISFIDKYYQELFTTSSYSIINLAKIVWRYGLDSIKMYFV